jgi:hypothetical protein
MTAQQLSTVLPFLTAQAEARLAQAFGPAQQLVDDRQLEAGVAWYEARNLVNQTLQRERATLHSVVEFTGGPADADADGAKALLEQATSFQSWIDAQAKLRGTKLRGTSATAPTASWANDADAKRVPVRIGEFGPLTYQNDDVLLARLGKERYGKIKLINAGASNLLNVRDQSELAAYEIVNFVNGKRTVGEIRDAVSAEYGALPVSVVADYLNACAEAGVIQWK